MLNPNKLLLCFTLIDEYREVEYSVQRQIKGTFTPDNLNAKHCELVEFSPNFSNYVKKQPKKRKLPKKTKSKKKCIRIKTLKGVQSDLIV